MNKIAITTGDPNGIGAEITIKALNKLRLPQESIVIISNKKILDFYGKLDTDYELIEIPFEADITPGKITADCGEFSYKSLLKAIEIKPDGLVTAPIAKNALYMAGHKFNGHTEILQQFLAHDGQKAEMLFVAKDFRVLLLTRHCALKDIVLTKECVVEKVLKLQEFFNNKLGIIHPKFALCGLNPHSGEDGILGSEELEILNPAVKALRTKGINITYPLPADTLFIDAAKNYYSDKKLPYDCYIANYHDQGLIPIKTVAGDDTVNMTIGLDIIRTSPGHGTAFDIAGKNIAREDDMIAAINAVLKFV